MGRLRFTVQLFVLAVLIAAAWETIWSALKFSLQTSVDSSATTGSRVKSKSEAQTSIDRAAVFSSTSDRLQIEAPLRYLERQERTCPNNTTIPVVIFPINYTGVSGELSHFFMEGVHHSNCLIHTNDYLHAPVWLVDAHRMKAQNVLDTLKGRLNLLNYNDSAGFGVPHLTIYQVDYGDHPFKTQGGVVDYQSLGKNEANRTKTNVTRFSVKYYKRSIVANRTMGPSFQNESLGTIHKYPHKMNHIPYGVRTDLVEVFNARISELLGQSIRHQNTSMISPLTPLHPSMVEHLRIHGVRSFWPAHHPKTDSTFWYHMKYALLSVWSPKKNPSNPYFFPSYFRCHVSKTLLDFSNELERNGTATSLRSSPYNIVEPLIKVGFSGEAAGVGRALPQLPYVYELLSYKIIVVSQRDEWEGHYRLMEAMMGGGLVLHDVMLVPPSRLVDGVHYVIYHSMNDLLEKVVYYLTHEEERRAIADRGWIQTMTHYRSWNLVEAMILDNIEMIR